MLNVALRLVEGGEMDREKALEAAISQIERNCGKGSIMRLGQNEKAVEVEAISTGSLGLDIALGIGGLPRGRVVEIYGPESSGKTTLALHVIAEAQKRGGICGFIDAEHALDTVYARKLGVDLENLLISQPDTGEQALEITDTLVRSGAIDVLVVDFRCSADPKGRARRRDGRNADGQPGAADEPGPAQAHRVDLQIPLHGHLHQPDPHEDRRDVRLAGDHERRQCIEILCLCAPRHQAHRRHQGARGGGRQPDPRQGGEEQGGPPFKQIEFDIMYGEGVSKTGELIDLGVKAGIVEKSGSWFSFDSERIGQGRENAKQYLKEHPQVAERIERAIRQNAGLIAGQILEGASEASGEGTACDESASGFAEDGTVAPIAGGAARRGRR
jgi:recombination protein RecA